MKLYVVTDLEGVAGVRDFYEAGVLSPKDSLDWDGPRTPHPRAKALLAAEANAAVDGFFEGGATEILVEDGHGPGGLIPEMLDSRVEYVRGGAGWPGVFDGTFDAVAVVGQHAKSGTPYGHLAHTQSMRWLDLSVNGVSVGEFGQIAMCGIELGVPCIFGSGDEAFAAEARDLVPGIEAVAVKRGLQPATGDDLAREDYARSTAGAIHLHPVKARRLIREGALRAIRRLKKGDFDRIVLTPPFERVVKLRPSADNPNWTISRETHRSSVIALMNMPLSPQPMEAPS